MVHNGPKLLFHIHPKLAKVTQMNIEGLILGGIIGAALIYILLYTGRKSQNSYVKIFCAAVVIMILLLELWPFIEYAWRKPSLENIVEIFENLSSFLVASIGAAIVEAVSRIPSRREY